MSMKKAVESLENEFAAISLSFNWLGMTRSLSTGQKAEAANVFSADADSMNASKKLFDRKHPLLKELNAKKSEIYLYWKENSLPFPEEGIRLFPRQDIDKVVDYLTERRDEMYEMVEKLDAVYDEMKESAKQRLGSLYNESDYPASLVGAFRAEWRFHTVTPPDYLMKLNPEVYKEEQKKIQAMFKEAAVLAEQAFTEELAGLVSHLHDKLAGRDENGELKVFRNSAVENLNDFFNKFKKLNVHSSADLDKLVEEAKTLVSGVRPDALRTDFKFRAKIASDMNDVKQKLDNLMTNRPRRLINRPNLEPV